MLVFKIFVVVAFLLCVTNFCFTVHMLLTANRLMKDVEDWAREIDRCNLRYIKQEFARLMMDNGLSFKDADNNNDENDNEND